MYNMFEDSLYCGFGLTSFSFETLVIRLSSLNFMASALLFFALFPNNIFLSIKKYNSYLFTQIVFLN